MLLMASKTSSSGNLGSKTRSFNYCVGLGLPGVLPRGAARMSHAAGKQVCWAPRLKLGLQARKNRHTYDINNLIVYIHELGLFDSIMVAIVAA